MRFTPSFVNPRSRSVRTKWLAFTLVAVGVAAPARPASADRVVILSTQGDAPPEVIDHIEDAVAQAVLDAGHEAVGEAWATTADAQEIPTDPNEMRAVAEIQGAEWLLIPTVLATAEGAYTLRLRAGYAPETRVEQIEVEVRASRERARLMEVVAALLRPTGLGEDAQRLSGDDARAREAEAAAAAVQAGEDVPDEGAPEAPVEGEEGEAEARAAFADREQERAEAEERARWEGRERYGDPPWVVLGGLGVRPLVAHGSGQGGAIGVIDAELGWAVSGVTGLEIRGGLELDFGAINALAVTAGAVYLASPFADAPVHLGAGLSIGLVGAWSGAKGAGFQISAAAMASWRFAGKWYLEGSLPEITYLTNGGGGLGIGLSARIGVRL